MRRLLRWYGANPLHLLALLGCFAVAGYAAARLVPSRPAGIAIWFLGAVIGHDLVLMPLYSLADWPAAAAFRHRAARLPATVPWINYLRVPAVLSGLLFLVWFPLILRLHTHYQASTTLSPDPFLWHWLGVTGALFLISATAFALRIRFLRRAAASPEQQPAPPGKPPASEQPSAPPRPLPASPATGTGHTAPVPDPCPGPQAPEAQDPGITPARHGDRASDPGASDPG